MPQIFNRHYSFRDFFFCAGEALWIFLTFSFVHYLLIGHYLYFYFLPIHICQAVIITLIFQLCLYFFDLYDLSHGLSLIETATRMTRAFGVGCIVLAVIYYSLPNLTTEIRIFWPGYFAICTIVLIWRSAYYFVLKKRLFVENILILGTGKLASDISKEVEGRHDSAYRIICFVGDSEIDYNPLNVPTFEKIANLSEFCQEKDIEKIVLALDDRRRKTPIKQLLECKLNGINIDQGVSFYESITGKLMVEKVDPSGIFFSDGFTLGRWAYLLKRLMDILLSIFGLLVSLPVTLISAVIVKLETPGPVFYLQDRVGEKGKIVKVIKFRSMGQDAEKDGAVWAMKNDTRVTRYGGFMRKVRIDEIPQMINVLKGEMSFVGPRPERPIFVDQLTESIPYYPIRHYIRPGITGWAQVCYPYGASEEDALRKLEYDLYYMKNISILMDLLVIFQTVKTVLFKKSGQ